MEEDNRPIGIFDSGVGGLTVFKRIKEELPNEKLIYFGDTKRVPYGIKDQKTITQHSIEIVKFLIKKNVKLIVIACNSISASSLEILNKEFKIPFMEVTLPGAEDAILVAKNNNIGVLATEATVRSKIYEKRLIMLNSKLNVYSKACTLFVPLVEEGWINNQVTAMVVDIYLQNLLNNNISTLILGCTHYPLLYNSIRNTVGENIDIIDPADPTSRKTKEFLTKNNMLNNLKLSGINNDEFYVSGDTDKFNNLCNKFIGYQCKSINIDLENY